MSNPFTPGFGTTPRIVIGRDEVIGQISRAFGAGFDPHRTTWLRSPRGTGKTVLLNEIQDLAGLAGWVVVQEDAQTDGSWNERIADRLELTQLAPARRRRIKAGSVSTPIGGASLELTDPAAPTSGRGRSLRDVLERVLDQTNPPKGVLITVDEIHNSDRHELAQFGNAIQHLIRADRPVAVVLAGLPQLDPDDLATFLSRCTTPELDRISDDAVRGGLQRTAELGGGRFAGDALELAVDITAGYPYMLQLIGYWSWDHSRTGKISRNDVHQALPHCQRELTKSVLNGLDGTITPVGRTYLQAMAIDNGPSRTNDIATRIGKTPKYAGTYRQRLIDAGIIVAVDHGYVDFAIPGHRAQIRADVATRPARPVANTTTDPAQETGHDRSGET